MNSGPATAHGLHLRERTRLDIQTRLNLIEGQVGGLRRMIDEDRACIDVLTQVASVRQAVRQVGRIILRNHLQTCVTRAIAEGNDEVMEELLTVLDQFSREG